MIVPEEELVDRARRGDLAALDTLVRKYQHMAYTIAYQIVGNADDAQDVCQESFIKLYRAISRYRPKQKFSAWFYRLVVNAAIDFRRREKRGRVSFEEEKERPDGDSWSHSDLRMSLERVLDELSPKQRSAFVLRDLQGFTIQEVARILGCSPVTTRVHLHNARSRIRKKMENEE